MSYAVLAFIVSIMYGFFGTLFLLYGPGKRKNTLLTLLCAFLFVVFTASLAMSTTGWASVIATCVGGGLIFCAEGDALGAILFEYGRIFLQLGDHEALYRSRLGSILDTIGQSLQRSRDYLDGRSVVGFCVRRVILFWRALLKQH